MSRTLRKQILATVDSLKQINILLQKLLNVGNTADVVQVLTDCQNSAIEIGNRIEQIYGMGTKSVQLLEIYCESIYCLSQNLERKQEKLHYYRQMLLNIDQIRDTMKIEIPDRLEVAFFPYKASMWDSLESVYLAATADENCDAYCVPIPYFDKKSDGSKGNVHYEGMDYPDDIKVIEYNAYDFENRLPDMIFIHNPYDNWNYVTTVPERFYSKNIKKYTEKLIYIPYFVLPEIELNNQEMIDKMSHFCFLPGTIYADKVILQSDQMCQIYINEYEKQAKKSGLAVKRKELRKKFLGLGSPKFDKVAVTEYNQLEVPQQWQEIIVKSDGTRKKVIFYNTSVSALLENSEKMISKIKNVLACFYENRNEIVLLWRPHPLIKATIESMRPQLWRDYDDIVKSYRKQGWGIYDDSAELERAIAISDGYYGDSSSVVQLYMSTGKPVMIQDVDTLTENNELEFVI